MEKKNMNLIDLEHPLNSEIHSSPTLPSTALFHVTEYGKTFDKTPCYQLRMDSHIACLQYVISGSGIILCDNNVYTVESGDTFLLPMKKNQIYYSNPDNHFERVWLNFKGTLAENLLNIYGLDKQTVFKQVNCLPYLTELQNACKNNTDPTAYERETSLAFFKIVQFLAAYKTEPKQADQIEQIRLYINSRIMKNIKLSTLAEHFYLTEEHIIRTFKKTYGITPHQYILQSKIRISMIMLRATKDSIEEIAHRLSFSDPHHFSAQFKKLVGVRPLRYRQSFPRV
jgi:AraC-like DNA-binding protein